MRNGRWLALGLGVVCALPGMRRAHGAGEVTGSGGLRLQLQRVTWRREGQLRFGGAQRPSRGVREVSGTATLEFLLATADPHLLDSIAADALKSRTFQVADDTGAVSRAAAALVRDEAGTRLQVVAPHLSPRATRLVRIQGALPRFLQSERIRFHVPWLKDEIPVRVEFGGAVATLQRFQLVGDDSTLWVRLTPPEGFRIADGGRDTIAARAMDIDGNLVNGGGITETELVEPGPNPVYRFFAPDMRRTPSRLMLDVLFVAGNPRWEPLRYGSVALPRENGTARRDSP